MNTLAPLIVWFRQDLRCADNPALHAAAASGRAVVPLFILDDTLAWAPGAASRWWLHGSLSALAVDLAKLGAPLLLKRGKSAAVLADVIAATGAGGVYWNRQYEPAAIARDAVLKKSLRYRGVEAQSFAAAVLFEPWDLKTQSGTPFRVFTPFYKAAMQGVPRGPLPRPKRLIAAASVPNGEDLSTWRLLPTKPDWLVAYAHNGFLAKPLR